MSKSGMEDRVYEELLSLFPWSEIHRNKRPDWLREAASATCLELDFFLPKSKIAIEVQGEQHYRYVPFFHGSYDGFRSQQRRDEEKLRLCELNGVELLYVHDELSLAETLSSFRLDGESRPPRFLGVVLPADYVLWRRTQEEINPPRLMRGLRKIDKTMEEAIGLIEAHRWSQDQLSNPALAGWVTKRLRWAIKAYAARAGKTIGRNAASIEAHFDSPQNQEIQAR